MTLDETTSCTNVPDQIAGAAVIDGGGNLTCGCPGDITFDDAVDGQDLATLLSLWGECDSEDPVFCLADLDGSGTVDGADLATILAYWGMCQ